MKNMFSDSLQMSQPSELENLILQLSSADSAAKLAAKTQFHAKLTANASETAQAIVALLKNSTNDKVCALDCLLFHEHC